MGRAQGSSRTAPWILGLSASHNGAACLLHGDRVAVAVQEERLSRNKRDRIYGARPSLAVEYCLQAAGIGAGDLDLVVVCTQGRRADPEQDLARNPQLRLAARGIPWLAISHHLGHAASAVATSGFDEAAVLVVDGVGSPWEDLGADERRVADGGPGDWEMISAYHARGCRIEPVDKQLVAGGDWMPKRPGGMPRFRTLGGMYSAVATQIFGHAMEAGKVMGLAPMGEAVHPVGDFVEMVDGRCRFRDLIPDRFRHEERWPRHERAYRDLARSVQQALEVAVLELARRLRGRLHLDHLCYAGGVALNCVLNERLHRESGYRAIHVPPAAEDSGPALGAAFHGLWHLTGAYRPWAQRGDGMGRRYPAGAVTAALAAVPGTHVARRDEDEVLDETVRRLAAGQVAGWFEGPSELGPRALGRRSILADPRGPGTRRRINRRIKGREDFRPFAPAILAEAAAEWFLLDGADPDSPFMLRAWPFRPQRAACVPAVVHADGSGRVQTVDSRGPGRFHALLCRFHDATGVPLLLNTSFNGPGEPIVETPEDALCCLLHRGLDFVVLEDLLVERREGVGSLLDLVPRVVGRRQHPPVPLPADGEPGVQPSEAERMFCCETPWGPRQQAVPAHVMPLLEAIDGERDGWGLLEALAGRIGRADREAWLADALARLRGAAIVTFAPAERAA